MDSRLGAESRRSCGQRDLAAGRPGWTRDLFIASPCTNGFAPSMVVFPGGRVDPADASGVRDPIRRCALRETAEETGVVLAEDGPPSLGALDHAGDRASPL